jgi:hypothetical protein
MIGRLRFATIATILGSLAPAGLAQAADRPGLPFRESIRADMAVTAGASKQAVAAKSDFDYRLTRTGAGLETAIDGFTLTTSVNGREASHTEMNRDAILIRERGETKNVKRADAPAEALAILDSFGTSLAVSKLDAEGGEVSRRAKPVAGPLADPAIVENTRIFHPKFARDRDSWDAPAVFPLGKGQQARGTLHYAKRKRVGTDGPVFVDVSGDLSVQGMMGKARITKGTYRVEGTQTYDPALGEWVAGDLSVAITMDAALPDGTPVKGGGTTTLTMFRRDPE